MSSSSENISAFQFLCWAVVCIAIGFSLCGNYFNHRDTPVWTDTCSIHEELRVGAVVFICPFGQDGGVLASGSRTLVEFIGNTPIDARTAVAVTCTLHMNWSWSCEVGNEKKLFHVLDVEGWE